MPEMKLTGSVELNTKEALAQIEKLQKTAIKLAASVTLQKGYVGSIREQLAKHEYQLPVTVKVSPKGLNKQLKELHPSPITVGVEFKPDQKSVASLDKYVKDLIKSGKIEKSMQTVGSGSTSSIAGAASAQMNAVAEDLSKQVKSIQNRLMRQINDTMTTVISQGRRLTGGNRQVYESEYIKVANAVSDMSPDMDIDDIWDIEALTKDLKLLTSTLYGLESAGQEVRSFDSIRKEIDGLREVEGVPAKLRAQMDLLAASMDKYGDSPIKRGQYQSELNNILKSYETFTGRIEATQSRLTKSLNASRTAVMSQGQHLTNANLTTYNAEYARIEAMIRSVTATTTPDALMDIEAQIKDINALAAALRKLETAGQEIQSFDAIREQVERLKELKNIPDELRKKMELLTASMTQRGSSPTAIAQYQLELNNITKALDTFTSKARGEVTKSMQSVSTELARIEKSAGDGVFGEFADEARIRIDAVKTELQSIDTMMVKPDIVPDTTQLDARMSELRTLQSTAVATNSQIDLENDRQLLTGKIESWAAKNTRAAKAFAKQLENIKTQIQGADSVTLGRLNKEFQKVEQSASALGKMGKTFSDTIKSLFQNFSPAILVASVTREVMNAFKDAVATLREVDTYLTEISKVSNRSAAELKALGDAAFAYASEYGVAVTTYLQGVQEWSRAGYEAQSEALGRVSVLAQAAGDMTSEMATSYLIATNAAYKLQGSAEKLTAVLDGQNQITNRNAVSMEELAAATRVAGAQAATSGVSLAEFSAAVGTIQAVTQQGGEVAGRAYKAVLMNLQQVSGTTEDGETIDEESFTKVQKALAAVNVQTTEFKDGLLQLRDPMEILSEIADVFERLEDSSIEKANIIEALGGKHRGSQLAALLDNWSLYEKMVSDFNDDALGSAAIEAEKTANSWEGSLARLSNTWAAFVGNFVNSDLAKQGINMLSGFVEALSGLSGFAKGFNLQNLAFLVPLFKILQSYFSGGGIGGGLLSGLKGAGNEVASALTSIFQALLAAPAKGLWANVGKGLSLLFKGFRDLGKQADTMSDTAAKLSKGLRDVFAGLIATGAVLLVSKIAEWISEKVHEAERIAEEVAAAYDKYKTTTSTNATNRQNYESARDELGGLIRGVSATGQNLSLTNEEYSRYLELCAQVAEIAPSLVSSYNSQNQPLITLTGSWADANNEIEKYLANQERLAELENAQGLEQTITNLRNHPYYDLFGYSESPVNQAFRDAGLNTQNQMDVYRAMEAYFLERQAQQDDNPWDDILNSSLYGDIANYDVVKNMVGIYSGFSSLESAIDTVRGAMLDVTGQEGSFQAALESFRSSALSLMRVMPDYEALNDDIQAFADTMFTSIVDFDFATENDSVEKIENALRGYIGDAQNFVANAPFDLTQMLGLSTDFAEGNINIQQYKSAMNEVLAHARTISGEFTEIISDMYFPDADILEQKIKLISDSLFVPEQMPEVAEAMEMSWINSLDNTELGIVLNIRARDEFTGKMFSLEQMQELLTEELEGLAKTEVFNLTGYDEQLKTANDNAQALKDFYEKLQSGELASGELASFMANNKDFAGIADFVTDGSVTDWAGLNEYVGQQLDGVYDSVLSNVRTWLDGHSADNPDYGKATTFYNDLLASVMPEFDAEIVQERIEQYREYYDMYAKAVLQMASGGLQDELLQQIRSAAGALGLDAGKLIGFTEDGEPIIDADMLLSAIYGDMASVANSVKNKSGELWNQVTDDWLNAPMETLRASVAEWYEDITADGELLADGLAAFMNQSESVDPELMGQLGDAFGAEFESILLSGDRLAAISALSEKSAEIAGQYGAALDSMKESLQARGVDTTFIDNYIAKLGDFASVAETLDAGTITRSAEEYDSAFSTLASALGEFRANDGTLAVGTIRELEEACASWGTSFADTFTDVNGEMKLTEEGLIALQEMLKSAILSDLDTRIDVAQTVGDSATVETLNSAKNLLTQIVEQLGAVQYAADAVDFTAWETQLEEVEAKQTQLNNARELKTARGQQLGRQDYISSLQLAQEGERIAQSQIDAIDTILAQQGVSEAYRKTLATERNGLLNTIYDYQSAQAEYERALLDLDTDAAAYQSDRADRALEQIQSDIDLRNERGLATTVQQYGELIEASQRVIAARDMERKLYQQQIAGVEVGSERYQELQENIESCDDAIQDAVTSQVQWNNAILTEYGYSGTASSIASLDEVMASLFAEQYGNGATAATASSLAAWLLSIGEDASNYLTTTGIGISIDDAALHELAQRTIQENIASLQGQLDSAAPEQRAQLQLEIDLLSSARAELTQASSPTARLVAQYGQLTTQLGLVNTALSEQGTSAGISLETYRQLIAANQDYMGMLEWSGTGLQLNTDAVDAYTNAQRNLLKEEVARRAELEAKQYQSNAKRIQELVGAYGDVTKAYKNLSDAERTELMSLLNNNKTLAQSIGQYNALTSSLDNAAYAYTRWQNAQSAPNIDEYFSAGQEAYAAFQEGLEYGKTGTGTDYAAAEELLFGSQGRTDSAQSYIDRWFKTDEDDPLEQEGKNVRSFVEDLKELGYIAEDESGRFSTLKPISMAEIVEDTGTSEFAIESMLKLLQAYGLEVEYFNSNIQEVEGTESGYLDELDAMLTKTREQLDKLNSKDVLTEQEQQLKTYYENLLNAGENIELTGEELVTPVEEALATVDPIPLPWEFALDGMSEKLSALTAALIAAFPKGQTTSDGGAEPAQTSSLDVNIDTEEATSRLNQLRELISAIAALLAQLGGSTLGDLGASAIVAALSRVLASLRQVDSYQLKDKTFSVTTLTNNIVSYRTVGSPVGASFAQGTKNAKPGPALVGELGREMLIRDGQYYMLGENGAQFVNLRKGDAILSAEDTRKVERGLPGARGEAFASGSSSSVLNKALAGVKTAVTLAGLAGATVAALKSGNTSVKSTIGSLASSLKSAASKYTNGQSATISGQLSTGTGSSSSKKSSGSSSGGSSGSAGGSSGSGSSNEKEWFDWIEIRLARLQRKTDNLITESELAVGYADQNSKLNDAMANVAQQIDTAAKAYERYNEQAAISAKETGLSSELIKQIQDGTIDITKYDNDTRDAISDYQEWYEKALDVSDSLYELRQQQTELATQKLDNIISQYEDMNSVIEAQAGLLEGGIKLADSAGRAQDLVVYTELISLNTQMLNNQSALKEALRAEFESSVGSGAIAQGSAEWYEYQNRITECDEAMQELQTSTHEFINEMNQIRVDRLEYVLDEIQFLKDELEDSVKLKEVTGKVVSAADYQAQAANVSSSINAYRNLLSELQSQLSQVERGSEMYMELAKQVADAQDSIRDLTIEQAELNRTIMELPLTRLQAQLEIIEATQSHLEAMMNLHETQGYDLTAEEYDGLIESGDEQIANLEAQRKALRRLIATTQTGSDLNNEYRQQLAATEDSILAIKNAQEEWNDAIIDLQIQKLQEQRDLLDEQNDAYQKRIDLEKAIQELERARTQKNKLIYRENLGFVYEADQDAIRDAQEDLDDKQHQETLDKIDEAIDALEDYKKVDNLYDYFANRINADSVSSRLESLGNLSLGNYVADAVDASVTSIADVIRASLGAQQKAFETTLSTITNNQSIAVNVQQITLQGVQDVSGLAQAIRLNLANALTQELYSNR